MARTAKKIGLATAAILAAVVLFLLATLPPESIAVNIGSVDDTLLRRTVRGAYHVHTTQSDGSGDRATVAAAASRAGLKFVLLTDHGDGTRQRQPSAYVDGVLLIDGVEISTNGGHYVALDMPIAPYPLGGDASAVVEDVARLGGFGIAAHPHHPRAEIAWADWQAPIDGIEWVNLDSEWRDDGRFALGRVAFHYLLRPSAAIASLMDRPVASIKQWDALAPTRPVVALAAVDAHGAGRRNGEGRAARLGIGPGYEASFRTVSNSVLLERPLRGDPTSDARLILDSIRMGSVYSVVDGIATGVLLRAGPDGTFELASPLPDGGRAELVEHAGRKRLEVVLDRAAGEPPVPWIISNWSGPRLPTAPGSSAPAVQTQPLGMRSEWRVEKDPGSTGQVSLEGGTPALHYVLADGRSSHYVALAADLSGNPAFDVLVFSGHAVEPMRVSVQLRFADGGRWVKSIYLGPDEREVVIKIAEMSAATRSGTRIPDPSTATSILFVVDLVNAAPADAGSFRIRNVRRGSAAPN